MSVAESAPLSRGQFLMGWPLTDGTPSIWKKQVLQVRNNMWWPITHHSLYYSPPLALSNSVFQGEFSVRRGPDWLRCWI